MSEGGRTDNVKALEPKIHEVQKSIGTDAYDFDKWWAKREIQGVSSINGPPIENSEPEKVPQGNFTVEQAMKKIGESDCAILEDCVKHAEAEEVFIAHILDKVNPTNKTNYARRGMVGNRAMRKFESKKAEKI